MRVWHCLDDTGPRASQAQAHPQVAGRDLEAWGGRSRGRVCIALQAADHHLRSRGAEVHYAGAQDDAAGVTQVSAGLIQCGPPHA